MKKLIIIVVFTVLSALQSSSLYAGEKLGKAFIKAASATIHEHQVPDQGLEDSVDDLKKRAGKFEVVDNEKDADYLLVVVDRSQKELVAEMSFKQNGQWMIGVRLANDAKSWGMAARRIMGQANDWVESRGK